MEERHEDYFDFTKLLPELRLEVIKHLDIQSIGRFIQINCNAEQITKGIWRRKIEEIDSTIWPKLTKRTRKGDLKLLCAIIYDGSVSKNKYN